MRMSSPPLRSPIALILTATLLAACQNTITSGSRQVSPSASAAPNSQQVTPSAPAAPGTTTSVRVSDSSQAVPLSSPSSFSLTLPAGALTSLLSQLGPVNVTAQAGAVSSLSAVDQAAVQAGTNQGASVLGTVQVDVAAAGSGTQALRTQQTTATTGKVSFTLQAGAVCASNSIIVKQVASGKATTLLGNALADKANKQQLSGSFTATFGDKHLAFFFLCLAAPENKPRPLVSGSPSPRPSASARPAGSPVAVPLQFKPPAAPFTTVLPYALLTVTETDFIGQEDEFFQDDVLGIHVTNYEFDIFGGEAPGDGQAQAGAADVEVKGAGTHEVFFDEELFDVMSEFDNVLVLSDETTKTELSMIADQELQNITLLAGNAFAVAGARRLSAQQLTNGPTNELTITNNPDGTWLIDEEGASTAQDAAKLVLATPIGAGASLHNLALLVGLLTNQQSRISIPTLTPIDCSPPIVCRFRIDGGEDCCIKDGDGQGTCPRCVKDALGTCLRASNTVHHPEVPPVTAYGQLTVKQVALPPAVSNLIQLLKAVIQQRQQT